MTLIRRKGWYRDKTRHMFLSQGASRHLTKMRWKTFISGAYIYISIRAKLLFVTLVCNGVDNNLLVNWLTFEYFISFLLKSEQSKKWVWENINMCTNCFSYINFLVLLQVYLFFCFHPTDYSLLLLPACICQWMYSDIQCIWIKTGLKVINESNVKFQFVWSVTRNCVMWSFTAAPNLRKITLCVNYAYMYVCHPSKEILR